MPLQSGIQAITTTRTEAVRALEQGDGYATGHRFEGLANNAVAEFVFTNPSGSGVVLNLEAMDIVGAGLGWFELFFDSTISSAGTSLTPRNRRVGASGSAQANVEHSGTYADGTEIERGLVPPNTGAFAIGAVGLTHLILEANHNVHVQLTNKSGGNADFAFILIWWEQ